LEGFALVEVAEDADGLRGEDDEEEEGEPG